MLSIFLDCLFIWLIYVHFMNLYKMFVRNSGLQTYKFLLFHKSESWHNYCMLKNDKSFYERRERIVGVQLNENDFKRIE